MARLSTFALALVLAVQYVCALPTATPLERRALSDEQKSLYRRIAADYMPVFTFHKDEGFFPMSTDSFFANTFLANGANPGNPSSVLSGLTTSSVASYCASNDCSGLFSYPNDGPGAFDIKSGRFPGWIRGDDVRQGKRPPVYTYIHVSNGGSRVDVYWYLFYGHNRYHEVINPMGDHIGDWEFTAMSFSINGNTATPRRFFLSRHSVSKHSGVIDYGSRDLRKDGVRPIVYVAKGSHGMYTGTGTQCYAGRGPTCWVAYDKTSEGARYTAAPLVVTWCENGACEIGAENQFDRFNGYYGVPDQNWRKFVEQGVRGPLQQVAWNNVRDRIGF